MRGSGKCPLLKTGTITISGKRNEKLKLENMGYKYHYLQMITSFTQKTQLETIASNKNICNMAGKLLYLYLCICSCIYIIYKQEPVGIMKETITKEKVSYQRPNVISNVENEDA